MTQSRTRGFTLIEMMIVVCVILILAAIAVPHLMSTVNDISLRYAAADFSGLVQLARIQAVRKNTSYTILQGALPSGQQAFYLDLPKTGVYANGDPMLPISPIIPGSIVAIIHARPGLVPRGRLQAHLRLVKMQVR